MSFLCEFKIVGEEGRMRCSEGMRLNDEAGVNYCKFYTKDTLGMMDATSLVACP